MTIAALIAGVGALCIAMVVCVYVYLLRTAIDNWTVKAEMDIDARLQSMEVRLAAGQRPARPPSLLPPLPTDGYQ